MCLCICDYVFVVYMYVCFYFLEFFKEYIFNTETLLHFLKQAGRFSSGQGTQEAAYLLRIDTGGPILIQVLYCPIPPAPLKNLEGASLPSPPLYPASIYKLAL